MRKGLKSAVVFCLSAGLVLTSLSGCSKKEKFNSEAAAVTVNDSTVSAGVINVSVRYNQANYESMYMSFGLEDPFSQDMYGYGTTLGDDVKEQVVTDMTHALLAEQKMEEYGVSLSDEDKEKISAAAADFIAANDEETLKEIGIAQADVERFLELAVIKERVETQMCADVDTEVSDEEAAQRKVEYVVFTPESETEADAEGLTETETSTEDTEAETQVEEETSAETETELKAETETEAETAGLTEKDATKTKASAETETEVASEADTEAESETEGADTEVVSEAEDTETEALSEAETETEDPETAAAKEKAREKAVEMIERVKGGEDFDAAAEAMGKSANTITFGEDYGLTELVEATEGVGDDTLIEEPVEATTGYYVVKVISEFDRDATDAEKENIVEQRKQDRISELYDEWKEAGEVSQDAEVLATIKFDYHLTQPTEAETEAAETEAEETETVTEAESAEEAKTEESTEGTEETEAETEAPTEETAETETEK